MSAEDSDVEDGRELLILYATETGNAQDAADYIARQCRKIYFQCQVASIDQISLADLATVEIVVFVVSTTGNGVEPRSMTPLWNDLLRSDLPADIFNDTYFSVFGLGDSAYEKFCWAAKKLSRRLQSLGFVQFLERGEGDDQHPLGIDGALRSWTEELLELLLEMFPLEPGLEPLPASEIPPPRVLLNPVSIEDLEHQQDPLITDVQYHTGLVKVNQRITSEDWYQDVRHFEFEFEDDIQYNPGDVAIIHPYASEEDVTAFLKLMDWEESADDSFEIEQSLFDQSLPDHLPQISTLRILFTRFLDFNVVPRRSFFELLRHFTTSDLEREKLDEFISPAGADELYEYCYKVRRTIHEVLQEFRNVKIPRDYVFDVFPALRPREFSIASSVRKHPHQVHLCIAIVKYRTKLKIPRKGVCTSYLSTLQPGDTLRIGLKKGLIKLPTSHNAPIICVGPGTGIAPMRAVIEQRLHAGERANSLYFGCRSKAKDHHYGDEWETYSKGLSDGDETTAAAHEQALSEFPWLPHLQARSTQKHLHYRVAFSRDGKEGEPRKYVQDLIREDAEHVYKVIEEQHGWVFISGSSNKMPAAVRDALVYALRTCGEYSEEAAREYVKNMVAEGRLIEECWS